MNLVLVDGSNLFYRAYFVTKYDKQAAQQRGFNSGWLEAHVFYSTLLANVSPYLPAAVIVCWDTNKSAYRTNLYPEYKSHRDNKRNAEDMAHQAKLRMVLNETSGKLGFLNLAFSGVEADDIIAYLWKQHCNDFNIVILSNDDDLKQFPGVTVVDAKGGSVIVTKQSAQRIIVTKVLQGDRSDNIRGIHGMGGQRGRALLEEIGFDYKMLLAHYAESLKAVQQLHLNYRLINLRYAIKHVMKAEQIRSIRKQIRRYYTEQQNTSGVSMYLRRLGLNNLSMKGNVFHEIQRENNLFCRRALRKGGCRRSVNTISV